MKNLPPFLRRIQMDVVYISLSLGLVVLSIGLILLCERL